MKFKDVLNEVSSNLITTSGKWVKIKLPSSVDKSMAKIIQNELIKALGLKSVKEVRVDTNSSGIFISIYTENKTEYKKVQKWAKEMGLEFKE